MMFGAGFFIFQMLNLWKKNISIFLAVNAKPAPLDYDTNVFFGHNFLASYWSVQQALASYWLDKGTNSTATSLTIDESYAAWD
jgi:hypothetical protein